MSHDIVLIVILLILVSKAILQVNPFTSTDEEKIEYANNNNHSEYQFYEQLSHSVSAECAKCCIALVWNRWCSVYWYGVLALSPRTLYPNTDVHSLY